MGKMPTDSLCKSSELKLHCFCLIDAYSMPKDICSVPRLSFFVPKLDFKEFKNLNLKVQKKSFRLATHKNK